MNTYGRTVIFDPFFIVCALDIESHINLYKDVVDFMIGEDYVCLSLHIVFVRAQSHLPLAVNHSLAIPRDNDFKLVRLSNAIEFFEVERLLELCENFIETCRHLKSLTLQLGHFEVL